MKRLSEIAEWITALAPADVGSATVQGEYIDVAKFQRIGFMVAGSVLDAGETMTLALFEAQDEAGTGAAAITGASAIATSLAKVSKVRLDIAAAGLADVVTINGVSFTEAAATSVPDREWADVAGLIACINDSVVGVDGAYATTPGANTVDVQLVGGSLEINAALTVSVTNVGGTIAPQTIAFTMFVDLDVSLLSDGFKFVQARLTESGTLSTYASVLAGGYDSRFMPGDPAYKNAAHAIV